jgi:hypothetical protein
MTPTWLVWSPIPPECLEKVSCTSMLDAGRAWAERQFRKGFLPRTGTEVLVCAEGDPSPRHSTCRLKISIASAPAFRAAFAGLAFEGVNGEPEDGRG